MGKKMKDLRASKSRGKVAIAYNKDAGMRNETTLRKIQQQQQHA